MPPPNDWIVPNTVNVDPGALSGLRSAVEQGNNVALEYLIKKMDPSLINATTKQGKSLCMFLLHLPEDKRPSALIEWIVAQEHFDIHYQFQKTKETNLQSIIAKGEPRFLNPLIVSRVMPDIIFYKDRDGNKTKFIYDLVAEQLSSVRRSYVRAYQEDTQSPLTQQAAADVQNLESMLQMAYNATYNQVAATQDQPLWERLQNAAAQEVQKKAAFTQALIEESLKNAIKSNRHQEVQRMLTENPELIQFINTRFFPEITRMKPQPTACIQVIASTPGFDLWYQSPTKVTNAEHIVMRAEPQTFAIFENRPDFLASDRSGTFISCTYVRKYLSMAIQGRDKSQPGTSNHFKYSADIANFTTMLENMREATLRLAWATDERNLLERLKEIGADPHAPMKDGIKLEDRIAQDQNPRVYSWYKSVDAGKKMQEYFRLEQQMVDLERAHNMKIAKLRLNFLEKQVDRIDRLIETVDNSGQLQENQRPQDYMGVPF